MKLVNVKKLNQSTFNVVTDEGIKQLSRKEVIEKLNESGLDLVEVSSSVTPIYKIMDYQKFLYEKEKKRKRNQKSNQVTKEMKFSLNIQEHDIKTKLKNIRRFLDAKDKVRIIVEMRGRESTYPEKALSLVSNILSQIDNGKLETNIKIEGRIASVTVRPK